MSIISSLFSLDVFNIFESKLSKVASVHGGINLSANVLEIIGFFLSLSTEFIAL